MKARYLVINVSKSVMEGEVEIEGEKVAYRRNVVRVELVPEGAHSNHGSVLLAASGVEVSEMAGWRQGDVIVGTFEKAKP